MIRIRRKRKHLLPRRLSTGNDSVSHFRCCLLSRSVSSRRFRLTLSLFVSLSLALPPDFSFDSAPAPPPDTFPLLSYLYYVWPCNVLGFLRDPAKYLHEKDRLTNIEGKEWEEVFDRQEVGDRSKVSRSNSSFVAEAKDSRLISLLPFLQRVD